MYKILSERKLITPAMLNKVRSGFTSLHTLFYIFILLENHERVEDLEDFVNMLIADGADPFVVSSNNVGIYGDVEIYGNKYAFQIAEIVGNKIVQKEKKEKYEKAVQALMMTMLERMINMPSEECKNEAANVVQ